jgi:cell division transport system ATP-binding protein
MIAFLHVSKTYDRRPALFDVTLQILKGEFVLLMGPSGAGKTTLLRLLHCAEKPDEGQILVQEHDIARLKPSRVPFLRRRMGFVFQDFKLLAKKTVFDNVALPLLAQGASAGDIRRKVLEALKAVGIDHKRDSRPPMLSAGEQQRVSIARAIVNGPLILLADEPTGNMDADLTNEIVDLFRSINARGTTVLIATHNEQIARQTGCRVITLQQGRVVSDRGASR